MSSMKLILALFSAILLLSSCSKSFYSASPHKKNEIYWTYYELCNSARDSSFNQNYIHASKLFNKAFNSVKNPTKIDLNKAIKIELLLGNYSKVKKYSSLLAKKYGLFPPKEYFSKETKNMYEELQNKLKPIIEKTKLNFNKEYMKLIDSLIHIDQNIRAQNKPNFNHPINYDSLNTHCLLKNIDKFGFPSADKVSNKYYFFAQVIFTHADFDKENNLLGDLLYDAVEQGMMSPSDYAQIIDRRCNFNGKPYVFFEIPLGYEKLDQEEKNKVTIRRKKIGLRSVEKSLKIITLPSGDIKVISLN